MKRFLAVTSIILSIFFLLRQAKAQGTQTVVNGSQTTPITFPSGGCTYNWVNNTPGIGLAASGTGDIAAFTAVNTGKTPISATITATPTSTIFAYIANQFSNNVSVVNTTTNTVIATIPVGDHPTGVSVSADGSKVYVTNYNDNTVSVINAATNTVSFTISVGSNPYGICVSPDGSRVYVANYHSNSVSVISTTSNTVLATVPVGSYPYGIAINPDGTRVYCASSNDDTMSVINTATNTVIATVAVGPHPYGVLVGADGTRVYVSSAYSNTITVVNTTNNTIVTTIKANYVSDTPAMSLSPDGSRLYLVDTYIAVINTATNAIISYIPANTPYSISISPDGNFLYGTDENTSTLWTYNLVTNMGAGSAKVGLNPISFGNFVNGPNCQPIEFTITVNPTSITPVITASSATGTISACQGSPSASPDIQQFTVSGTSLTSNITATAPAGFEVSLSAGNGYGNTVTVPESGGTANNIIVYVRSAASAIGSISGNVTLTSPGANTQNVAVSGKVNPLPTINAVANQTVVTGSSTNAINFTGTANKFSWTNNNPSIGLPASGTGDIASFTAVNTGTTPVTATITATPANAGYAYIADFGTASVSVISTQTNQVIGSIPVGSEPQGIALSSDGTRMYVTNQYTGQVSVINTATNAVIASITVDSSPEGVVVSPDGSRIYVTSSAFNNVAVINTVTNTIVTRIAVGGLPTGIAISPDGSKVYVANGFSYNVSVISTATNTVTATINVGSGPWDLAVGADGKFLYVTNSGELLPNNTVSVVSTATNQTVATIIVGSAPVGIAISPDGGTAYVVNNGSNSVSVINTATNIVVATISVGDRPVGVSFTGDGNKAYVTNQFSDNVSVIDTKTNTVIATVNAERPSSFGNFVSAGNGCTGVPVTFTITVTSTPPTIDAGTATGTISACEGSPSESPNVAQFTVSGNGLTNDMVATAPSGFEVSLSTIGGYGASVTIPQSAGAINNVIVYVRSAASATGNISGAVTLTSMGATDKTVTVTGKVNALPTVSNIPNQKVVNGTLIKGIIFNGTGADTYNWVNDNPSIGISSGTSSEIVQFTATNTSQVPVIGTFTVTPINTTTGCSGAPVTFTIEVDPILPAVITATGTLSSFSTIYGTASASTSFSVSGTNMNAGILVTLPAGFEISTDNTNFSPTVTIGTSGTINATTVYVRLTSQTPVGSYSGNIVLSSSGGTSSIVPIPVSVVNPAVLTIIANNVQKVYGQTLTSGTVSTGFTSNRLQNNETIGNVFITYNSGAGPSDKAGTYIGSVVPSDASGGSFNPNNYTITYQSGDIVVIDSLPNQPIAIPNAFTPNGDGINDVWNVKSLIDYPSCLVSIFTRYGSMVYQSRGYAKPWDGVYNGNPLPAGTYYYIINLQNGQPQFSGWVALIR